MVILLRVYFQCANDHTLDQLEHVDLANTEEMSTAVRSARFLGYIVMALAVVHAIR